MPGHFSSHRANTKKKLYTLTIDGFARSAAYQRTSMDYKEKTKKKRYRKKYRMRITRKYYCMCRFYFSFFFGSPNSNARVHALDSKTLKIHLLTVGSDIMKLGRQRRERKKNRTKIAACSTNNHNVIKRGSSIIRCADCVVVCVFFLSLLIFVSSSLKYRVNKFRFRKLFLCLSQTVCSVCSFWI